MSVKTAKKKVETKTVSLAQKLWGVAQIEAKPLEAAYFAIMRALKVINPGDSYLENYIGMKKRYAPDFYDTYQLLWTIGIHLAPKNILEIGSRTGISICQLLSAHSDRENIESIVCVDPFDQWTSANLIRANMRYLGLVHEAEKAKIHPITSDMFFSSSLNGPVYDFILVDGDHSKEQAFKDLENAAKLIRPAGVIVFDDISTAPGECALIDVWEKWVALHKDEFEFEKCMFGKGVAFAIKK